MKTLCADTARIRSQALAENLSPLQWIRYWMHTAVRPLFSGFLDEEDKDVAVAELERMRHRRNKYEYDTRQENLHRQFVNNLSKAMAS